MFRIERVLFTTDFSDASNHALPHALGLSERYGAELVIGHIRTPLSDSGSMEEYQQFVDERSYIKYVENKLDRTSSRIEHRKVRTLVRSNVSSASGILEMIESEGIDLVVMGTHGRTGLGHFVLGSVAEKVMRHCQIPVLSVSPRREGYRDNPQYRRILVGFDFSSFAKQAVLDGLDIAAHYDARFGILNVIEQSVHSSYYENWKKGALEEAPKIKKDIETALSSMMNGEDRERVEIHLEIGDGDGRVAGEIKQFSEINEVDLLIIGTHGLSGFEHLLLGSTAERLIRIAPCPVLTLHLRES